MMISGSTVTLERFVWHEDPEDKDANFKRDVALYTNDDPMPTVRRLSNNLNIPAGAVIRYILCKWAASGSDALLETGADMVEKMSLIFKEAEDEAYFHFMTSVLMAKKKSYAKMFFYAGKAIMHDFKYLQRFIKALTKRI